MVQNLPEAEASAQSETQEFSQWRLAETDGQPFFLTETLKALIERGRQADGRKDLESALRERRR